MSESPIEFLSTREARRVGASEFGGESGLIQPAEAPGGGEGHAILDATEVAGIAIRHGSLPLSGLEQVSGEQAGPVVDPVSGRVVSPADLEDVTGDGGQLSDLKP